MEKLKEKDVLELVEYEGAAGLLLDEKIPDARKRFKKLDKALIDYLAYIRKTFPDARYYTNSGGFNLILGRSHNDRHEGQPILCALSGRAKIDDGAW
jgi:hypothetical protein